jgi:protease-4
MAAAKSKPNGKRNNNTFLKAMFLILAIFLIIAGISFVATSKDGLKPAVAVIPIHGTIGIGSDADPTEIIENLQAADSDIAIKAIIIEINSPGGSAVASQDIAEAVKNMEKPTVAWIREVGASGAFWVASAADKVVAAPASVTGSIGVTASYVDFARLMDTYGITYNRLVTGEFKDTGTPFKELTAGEREYLLEKLFSLKDTFVAAIAANRNLAFDYVDNLATGEIWFGEEAKGLGFVDVIGGKEAAQDTAEQLAGIKDSRLVRIEEKRPRLLDLISGSTESVAYWMGQGMGAAFLAASKDKKIPVVEA